MSVETPTIEEKQTEQTVQEVKLLEEVAELEEPIKKIIEKIKDGIENSEYGLIIGDDASGRIPAPILGNFIKKVSETRGTIKPNIIFIPGKLEMESWWGKMLGSVKLKSKKYEELDKYISSQGASKEKKVLIVTDTVQSGSSLKTLLNLLTQAGYSCDIATIGIEGSLIKRDDRYKNLRGVDVISGEYHAKHRDWHQNTPRIYERESNKYTGVYKNPGDKVSKSLKSSALPDDVYVEDVNPESVNTHDSRQEIQDSVNKAREDTKVIVDHLIDWYESRTKSSSPMASPKDLG